MIEEGPQFDELLRLDEEVLATRLQAARATVTHAGEKGRSLEYAVTALLRSILPAEYGLSTGFIAFHGGAGRPGLTSQLDIIIYDAARCGPLARLGSCDVFPLEAVYGYVEVKASIRASDDFSNPPDDSLEACVKTNSVLSRMTDRWFYESLPGSAVKTQLRMRQWTRIRGFVVAFTAAGSLNTPEVMAQRMADASAHYGESAHLHGVLVVGAGYFRTRPVDQPEDRHHVQYTTTAPLAAFRTELLISLNRFQRFSQTASPALGKYFREPLWAIRAPAKLPPQGED